ncbi:titin isoform X2 [Nematostella vectensis]|uniref:titin isoform X2 n=1 Tax=Nematostella vectensis TaxID=45351 RepID=UPI0020775558|nr:titin isoform X2 [Nematostella vectensis]
MQILWLYVCYVLLRLEAVSSSSTWQWQFDRSVCLNDGDNATMTWNVTLESGQSLSGIEIWEQSTAPGATPSKMYTYLVGPEPAYSDRVMSISLTDSSPVYHIVFTLANVSNNKDGFGTKSLQCRVAAGSLPTITGQPPLDTVFNVQVPPSSVVISPPSPTVTERDQVNLTCSADGTPPPNFTWISPQGHTVAHGPYYNIPIVHRNMSGVYTCVATDGCGRNHTRDATLAVRYKPDNTSLTILGGNASAQCGSKISFNCTADGVPKPNKYSLYLGNQAMKTDTNGEFSNIQLNTSGEHVFTCVPTNEIGEGLNKTVIVNASEVLPVVSVDIPPNGRMVKGSSVTLTCDGTGPVPLQISWYKDNIFNASGKTLTISKVTVQDEGNYTCNLSSSCGTTLNTSFIGVDYIPENTTLQINKSNNTSIIACVGDIILLNCYAEGKPSVITYSLLLNGEQHKANRSGVFLVFPGTPGWNNFSCVPNNTIGKGPEALVHIIVPVTPSSVEISPPSPTVTERDQVNLTCSADGTPPPTFTWISPQGNTVAHGPSYTIPMVHRNMTGMVYTCVATNGCGKNLTKDANLAVQYKPVNTSLTILGGDASRQCGSNVSFNCTADGAPKPHKYSLYLGNQTIKTNTNGVLSNIKLNTSGEHVFTCVPTNEIGEGLNKTVIVNASEVLPVVSVDIPPNGRMVKGSSVTLTCDGTGPVPLQISWYKDNIFIGSGKTLTISKVTVQDEGNYTCNVSSSCGTTLNTSFIIVDYKPENTTLRVNTTNACVGEMVQLNCSAVGKPAEITYILKMNGKLMSQNGISLVRLNSPVVHTFACIPNNTAGSGQEANLTIPVSEPPSIVQFPSKNIILTEGDSKELMCNASGSPSPAVTWYKLGIDWVDQNVSKLALSTREDTGSYRCMATNAAPCKNTSFSSWINVTVHYFDIETSGVVCSPFNITVRTNLNPTPSINCTWGIGGSGTVIQGVNTASDQVIYSVNVQGGQTTNVTCSRGNNKRIYTVVSSSDKAATTNGSIRFANMSFPPTEENKTNINRLFNETVPPCTGNVKVYGYRRGSVIVDMAITMSEKVADPFALLKDAFVAAGATYGLTIDPTGVKAQQANPSDSTTSPPSLTTQGAPTTAAAVTPKEGLTDVVIALIVVGVIVFLLIICGLVFWFCAKKKKKKRDIGADNLEMFANGTGTSPYAEVGPTAHANGGSGVESPYSEVEQRRNNDDTQGAGADAYPQVDKSKKSKPKEEKEKLPDMMQQPDPNVTYAQVDKSLKKKNREEPMYAQVDKKKKKPKKKPGELLYADLSDFTDGPKPKGDGTLEFASGEGVKRPEAYRETDYAEISHVLRGKTEDTQPTAMCFPPGPPTFALKNCDVKETSVRLRWTPPLSDNGSPILDYKVEVSSVFAAEGISSTSILIPELEPNTKYLARVAARNAAGLGTAAEQSFTTRGKGVEPGQGNAAFQNEAYEPDQAPNDSGKATA